ncbi:hypothetical protein AGROH133_05608 [Agrobacterium tumefaciens]|nr:hypothetical protein AGROH133_05608 [Agrobacterium tumefaciens]
MVPFRTLCLTSWGVRHIHFSRLEVEFRNADFKSPEETTPRNGTAVKFKQIQRRLLLPTFPVIPQDQEPGRRR